jgi:5-methylcytosine-specific restriction endonuclease McrA
VKPKLIFALDSQAKIVQNKNGPLRRANIEDGPNHGDQRTIKMADENMGEVRPVVTRQEAKALGLKRYWTGTPCKHGHVAERATVNGVCVACMVDIEARHRAAHPEKFREKWRRYEQNASPERRAAHRVADKKWRDANKERVAEKVRAWGAANPERKLEHTRQWRSRNLEKKQAQVREWRDANRHSEEYRAKATKRALDWAKANPEGVRKNTHARRARLKGAEGSHTVAELLAILKLQEWKCAEPTCQTSLRKHRHLDHIMPLTRGGTNNADNLQYLCQRCNCRKHNKDPIAWAQENGRLL